MMPYIVAAFICSAGVAPQDCGNSPGQSARDVVLGPPCSMPPDCLAKAQELVAKTSLELSPGEYWKFAGLRTHRKEQ